MIKPNLPSLATAQLRKDPAEPRQMLTGAESTYGSPLKDRNEEISPKKSLPKFYVNPFVPG